MMGKSAIAAALATAALAIAAPAMAQSASAWKLGRDGATPQAEGFSERRGASIRLQCVERKAIWLRFSPPRGWDGGAAVVVRVDGVAFPMEIDGSHDGALLSDLPNHEIGLSRKLIDALKTGRALIVEGPAAAKIPAPQRTFSLQGAGEAVIALERRCPGLK